MSAFKEYFVDANIFLRVLVRENEKAHQECLKVIERIKRGEIRAHTATLVVAEISWVLSSLYRQPKSAVVRSLNSILKLSHLSVSDRYAIGWGMTLYERHAVKFIDAIIASHELLVAGMPIISYDKDFDKLGVKRITPAELIKTK